MCVIYILRSIITKPTNIKIKTFYPIEGTGQEDRIGGICGGVKGGPLKIECDKTINSCSRNRLKKLPINH